MHLSVMSCSVCISVCWFCVLVCLYFCASPAGCLTVYAARCIGLFVLLLQFLNAESICVRCPHFIFESIGLLLCPRNFPSLVPVIRVLSCLYEMLVCRRFQFSLDICGWLFNCCFFLSDFHCRICFTDGLLYKSSSLIHWLLLCVHF